MKYWLLKYRTQSGAIRVARVLTPNIQDAWRSAIGNEWANHADLAVELIRYRCDGEPNLAKGARAFEYIETEEVTA